MAPLRRKKPAAARENEMNQERSTMNTKQLRAVGAWALFVMTLTFAPMASLAAVTAAQKCEGGTASPLSLERELYIEKNTSNGPVLEQVFENTILKTGDKLVSRVIIRVDRDMEYVHMKDMRAAAFEPTDVAVGLSLPGRTWLLRIHPRRVGELLLRLSP